MSFHIKILAIFIYISLTLQTKHMKKNHLLFALGCLAILSSCKKDMKEDVVTTDEAQISSVDQMFQRQTEDKYVPNELLIKFKKNTSPTNRSNAMARIGGAV